MAEGVLLDEIHLTFTLRPGRRGTDYLSARKALTRGGFVPRLRKLVRGLMKEFPGLRHTVTATVGR